MAIGNDQYSDLKKRLITTVETKPVQYRTKATGIGVMEVNGEETHNGEEI